MEREDIAKRLVAEGVVPVLRFASAELNERAIQCLLDVGFGVIEVAMTTPGALATIEKFAAKAIVGAGTVLDAKLGQSCLDAGAQFLVSPALRPAVVRTAHEA